MKTNQLNQPTRHRRHSMTITNTVSETTSHDVQEIIIHSYQLDNGAFIKYIDITNDRGQNVRHTVFSTEEITVKQTKEA